VPQKIQEMGGTPHFLYNLNCHAFMQRPKPAHRGPKPHTWHERPSKLLWDILIARHNPDEVERKLAYVLRKNPGIREIDALLKVGKLVGEGKHTH